MKGTKSILVVQAPVLPPPPPPVLTLAGGSYKGSSGVTLVESHLAAGLSYTTEWEDAYDVFATVGACLAS